MTNGQKFILWFLFTIDLCLGTGLGVIFALR